MTMARFAKPTTFPEGPAWRRLAGLLAGLVLATWLGGGIAGSASAAELVMFNEAGCSWCARFEREIGPVYPKTAEGRRAPLKRIDIARARQSGIALKSPVTVTPTFVLVDGGVEVGRVLGYPGEDFFWGLLAELIAKLPAEERAPLRDAAASGAGNGAVAVVEDGLPREMRQARCGARAAVAC